MGIIEPGDVRCFIVPTPSGNMLLSGSARWPLTLQSHAFVFNRGRAVWPGRGFGPGKWKQRDNSGAHHALPWEKTSPKKLNVVSRNPRFLIMLNKITPWLKSATSSGFARRTHFFPTGAALSGISISTSMTTLQNAHQNLKPHQSCCWFIDKVWK